MSAKKAGRPKSKRAKGAAETSDGTVVEKTATESAGDAWERGVARVMLNAAPINPFVRMKKAAKDLPMSREEIDAFRRDRLLIKDSALDGGPKDEDGPDRWAASSISKLWATRVFREGVASQLKASGASQLEAGVASQLKECNEATVATASEVALWSLDALAAWEPEYFELIAQWMRACGQKTVPTWETALHAANSELEAAGVPITKARLREIAIRWMELNSGVIVRRSLTKKHVTKPGERYLNEPTKWAHILKAAGYSEAPEGKHGPAPGFANARRKERASKG